jgi:hypothetical protein
MIQDKGLPTTEMILEARNALAADPFFTQSLKKLSHTGYSELSFRYAEWLVTYYNFASYRRHLQRLKRRKALHQSIEAHYLVRFQQLIEVTRSSISAGGEIVKLFSDTGVDELVEKHKLALFALTPDQESTKVVRHALASCGASEKELTHYATWLRGKKWRLLDVEGSDGTFAGLIRLAEASLPELEQEYRIVQQHGLPAIDGASFNTWVEVLSIVFSSGLVLICYAMSQGGAQVACYFGTDGGVSEVTVADIPDGSD